MLTAVPPGRYEEEISRLQRELEARGGGGPPIAAHAGNSVAPQPTPPSIGHGPRDLFGGIMSGQGGQGGPGLAPPQPDPQQQQQQQQQQHQIPPPPTAIQQQQPLPAHPQQPQPTGYAQAGFMNGMSDPGDVCI